MSANRKQHDAVWDNWQRWFDRARARRRERGRGSRPRPRSSGTMQSVRMPFQPMLASASAPRRLLGRWVMEPKFDGWRVIVAIDGEVRVWTRRGHELTARLPELAPLADVVDVTVVLDGELVAGQGRASDFYGVLGRVGARHRTSPLTFVAFDVLAFDGPVIDQRYRHRRALTGRSCIERRRLVCDTAATWPRRRRARGVPGA